MKRNEKILVAALVCIVVGSFGWPAMDSLFLVPTREAKEKLARVEKSVGDKRYEQMDLETAKVQIDEWSREGLPVEPTTAQRLYILWLRDVASLTGLTVRIEPGTRRPAGSAYTAIQANLTGEGTYSELQDFWEMFRRVNLLHRIVQLETGPVGSAEGDPRIPIEIVVEGLSVRNDISGASDEKEAAAQRTTLFPQTELSGELGAEETSLASFGEALSIKAGDRLRMGEELLAVVETGQQTLTVERGMNGTTAATHEAGTKVELYPSRRDTDGLERFAAIESPFVKPSPTSGPNTPPVFASTEEPESRTVFHGDTVEWEFAANDEESPDGLKYSLDGAPEGASIDEKTGKLSWKVPESQKPGEAKFVVKVSDAGEPAMTAEQSLTVIVKENLKPYVHLVGTTSRGETWDAWLWDRSEGKRISLHEGEPFQAVGVSGTVEEISADEVLFNWDGGMWKLKLGDNLGEMKEVEAEPVAAIRPPVEAPRPGLAVVADARKRDR